MESSNNNLCAICHSIDNNQLYTLPCSHTFHNNCIIDWFRLVESKGECPVCRDNPNKNINKEFIYNNHKPYHTNNYKTYHNNNYKPYNTNNNIEHSNIIKKNISPYNAFVKKNIKILKQQNPDKLMPDIFKLISEKWKISDENPKNKKNE
jgi:hypothetical protein